MYKPRAKTIATTPAAALKKMRSFFFRLRFAAATSSGVDVGGDEGDEPAVVGLPALEFEADNHTPGPASGVSTKKNCGCEAPKENTKRKRPTTHELRCVAIPTSTGVELPHAFIGVGKR